MTIQAIISELTLELTQAKNRNEQSKIIKLIDYLSLNQSKYDNDFNLLIKSITDTNAQYQNRFETRMAKFKESGIALFLPAIELKNLADAINEYTHNANQSNLVAFVEKHKNNNVIFEDAHLAYNFVASFAHLKSTFTSWEKLSSIIDPQVEVALSRIHDKSPLGLIALANITRYLDKHPTASNKIKEDCKNKIEELNIDKKELLAYDMTFLREYKCKLDEEKYALCRISNTRFRPGVDNTSLSEARFRYLRIINTKDVADMFDINKNYNNAFDKEMNFIENQNHYNIYSLTQKAEKEM